MSERTVHGLRALVRGHLRYRRKYLMYYLDYLDIFPDKLICVSNISRWSYEPRKTLSNNLLVKYLQMYLPLIKYLSKV
jgi:hypothetical protein